jgi:hypothetical protein
MREWGKRHTVARRVPCQDARGRVTRKSALFRIEFTVSVLSVLLRSNRSKMRFVPLSKKSAFWGTRSRVHEMSGHAAATIVHYMYRHLWVCDYLGG